jgi:CelD/BcsL family acetyltransferase involved in cellulose biosynthesis
MSVVSFQGFAEPCPETTASRAVVATTHSDLLLSVFTDLNAVEAPWRALERGADCTAFQAFDWLAAWQQHVGARRGARPVIVLGQGATGETVFVLPLAVEHRGGGRRLTFLGHDLCDYNAPLLAENFVDIVGRGEFKALWREITAVLQCHAELRHDAVELTKMPDTVGGQPNPFLELKVERNPNGAAYLARLGADWEGFYRDKRSSATRRRDRTKRNRLAQHGALGFVNVQTADEAARTLQTLMRQKRKSLARIGVSDIFDRPGYREFYLELATNPRLHGLVHVSRFDVGAHWAATNLGLTFRGCYYHVLASYTDGGISRFGPGSLHLRELLRHAIEHGFKQFDFTIGDEPYKREWSDRIVYLFDHTAAATLRGWPAVFSSACLRRSKRLIKQTPFLHRLVVRVRVAARARFGS